MSTTQVILVVVVIIGFFCHIQARTGNHFPPLLQHALRSTLKICNFSQIYQLGDSLSDTGNLILEYPIGVATPFSSLPYGESFYKSATGRCSDGMLMIDYIAMSSGLPLLNPYEKVDSDFRHGVNFAVAGATALPNKVLADWNIPATMTNSSLNVQLSWMSKYFNSICQTNRDCAVNHRSSLFVVGEIGGNDINYAVRNGKTIEEVHSMLPIVVHAIKEAVQTVIDNGAIRVIVNGNFPMGCLPEMLTLLQTNDLSSYDEHKCLKEINNLSMYENKLILEAIKELKQENPNAIIAYGDYYHAFEWLYRNAESFGFDVESLQKCCCGSGGDYNYDSLKFCGHPEASVCDDPSRFIIWDGIHFTQEAYKLMSSWVIANILPQLQCFRSTAY